MSNQFSRARDNMHRKKGSKGKYKVDKGIKEFYNFYFNSGKRELKFSYDFLKSFIPEFMKKLMDIPIDTGEHVHIPNLGVFLVISKEVPMVGKNPKKFIDWKATLELWEVIHKDKTKEEIMALPYEERKYVFHRNKGSDGYKLEYYWLSTWYNKYLAQYKWLPVTRLVAKVGSKMRENPDNIVYRSKDLLLVSFGKKKN